MFAGAQSSGLEDSLAALDPLQQEYLHRAIASGEIDEAEAIREANAAIDFAASAIGIVWYDEQVGLTRCEVIVVEGAASTGMPTPKDICAEITATREHAEQKDPFQPHTDEKTAPVITTWLGHVGPILGRYDAPHRSMACSLVVSTSVAC